jgi:hypothetical protein
MPLKNQLHVDQLLSKISVKYRSTDYIWDRVFPKLGVKKDSDLYRVYSRDWRLPETKRANGGLANEKSFEVSTASYLLEKHAQKDYVTDDDADNYDAASLRADVTENLTDILQRRIEKTVADKFTTTNWSQNVSLAATAAFNLDTTVSNPIPQYDTAATTIIANSGMKPNFAILPRDGFVGVKNHQSVLDRIKYTSREVTEDMIASLFGLEELLIPLASLDTSREGLTDTVSQIYGDISFVGYKPKSPSPFQPSCGYTFMKSQPKVKRWRVEEREAEAIEVNMAFDCKIVASLSGYLIKDIV